MLLAFLAPAFLLAQPGDEPSVQQEKDSLMLHLKGEVFNSLLDKAIEYQKKSDVFRRQAIDWRNEASRMDDPTRRGQLQKRIEIIEDSAGIYSRMADEQFTLLNEAIPREAKEKPSNPFLVKDTVLNGITVYRYNLSEEFVALLEEIRNPAGQEEAEKTGEPPPPGEPGTVMPDDPSAAGFRIYKSSPYGPDKPVESGFTIPPGVFYRIQLAVYKSDLPADHFGGLSPITSEIIPERELTRYFAGKFTRMSDARNALVKVKAAGYPDAFIIGYYNGKRSSFSKLEALEK